MEYHSRRFSCAATVYDCPKRFLAETQGFLCRHETENHLLLGIAAELCEPCPPYTEFFLAAAGGKEPEGVCLLTPPHRVQISSPCSERALDLFIAGLGTRYPQLAGALGAEAVVEAFVHRWTAFRGCGAEVQTPEIVYQLSSVSETPRIGGTFRPATVDDAPTVLAWSADFAAETGQLFEIRRDGVRVRQRLEAGQFFLWEDGSPVALARASGATPNGIRIGQVYTPPEWRGRGYATALVAEISKRMLSGGRRFCFLFADTRNPASNKVYQRIGYRAVARFLEYSFRYADESGE